MAAFGEKFCDRVDQRQAGAHRILGVGFMRFRVAEINQHAVAHIFRDIAAEAADHFGGAFVIGGDHFAQIFRIELRRQRGRADEIAEHYRELAALGRRRGAPNGGDAEAAAAGAAGRRAGSWLPPAWRHIARKSASPRHWHGRTRGN